MKRTNRWRNLIVALVFFGTIGVLFLLDPSHIPAGRPSTNHYLPEWLGIVFGALAILCGVVIAVASFRHRRSGRDQNLSRINPHGAPVLKVIALLAFALLIAVLSSLGTYWYMNNKPTQEVSPPPVQDETAEWKTYTSKQVTTLSFKYPSDWEIENAAAPNSDQEIVKIKSPNETIINFISGAAANGCAGNIQFPGVITEANTLPKAPDLNFVVVKDKRYPNIEDIGIEDHANVKLGSPHCFGHMFFTDKTNPNKPLQFELQLERLFPPKVSLNVKDKDVVKKIFNSLNYIR